MYATVRRSFHSKASASRFACASSAEAGAPSSAAWRSSSEQLGLRRLFDGFVVGLDGACPSHRGVAVRRGARGGDGAESAARAAAQRASDRQRVTPKRAANSLHTCSSHFTPLERDAPARRRAGRQAFTGIDTDTALNKCWTRKWQPTSPATTTGGCGGCLRTATCSLVSATRIQSRFRGARARRRVRLALQQLDRHGVHFACCSCRVATFSTRGVTGDGGQQRRFDCRGRRRAPNAATRRRGDSSLPTCAAAATPVGPRGAVRRRHAPPLVRARAGPPRDRPAASDRRAHARLRRALRLWASPSFDTWCRVAASRRRQRTALCSEPASRAASVCWRPSCAGTAQRGGSARGGSGGGACGAWRGGAAARAARCVAREWRGGRALVRCALARPAVWRGGAAAGAASARGTRSRCGGDFCTTWLRASRSPSGPRAPAAARVAPSTPGGTARPRSGRCATRRAPPPHARRPWRCCARRSWDVALPPSAPRPRAARRRRGSAGAAAVAAALVAGVVGAAGGTQCVRAETRGDGRGAAAAAKARAASAHLIERTLTPLVAARRRRATAVAARRRSAWLRWQRACSLAAVGKAIVAAAAAVRRGLLRQRCRLACGVARARCRTRRATTPPPRRRWSSARLHDLRWRAFEPLRAAVDRRVEWATIRQAALASWWREKRRLRRAVAWWRAFARDASRTTHSMRGRAQRWRYKCEAGAGLSKIIYAAGEHAVIRRLDESSARHARRRRLVRGWRRFYATALLGRAVAARERTARRHANRRSKRAAFPRWAVPSQRFWKGVAAAVAVAAAVRARALRGALTAVAAAAAAEVAFRQSRRLIIRDVVAAEAAAAAQAAAAEAAAAAAEGASPPPPRCRRRRRRRRRRVAASGGLRGRF